MTPPPREPEAGLMAVTVGATSKVKRSDVLVLLVPAGVVTLTSTVPKGSAGDTAVIVVAETTV